MAVLFNTTADIISINGSTEIEGGTVNVKNLETGEQKAFELSDISGILGFIA